MPARETEEYSPIALLGKRSANGEKVHTQHGFRTTTLQTWNHVRQLPGKLPHPAGTLPELHSGLHIFSLKLFEISPKRNGKRSQHDDTWEREKVFFMSVSLYIYLTKSSQCQCLLWNFCPSNSSSKSVFRAYYFQDSPS